MHPHRKEAEKAAEEKLTRVMDGHEMTAGAVSGPGRLQKLELHRGNTPMKGEEKD